MKKNVYKLFLFAVMFSLSACQQEQAMPQQFQADAEMGIINGKPVKKSNPTYWMTARLIREVDGVWYPVCTASILAKDLILTAAHCVEYADLQKVRIAFGAQPLTYEIQQNPKKRVDVLAKFKTIAVKALVTHPEYGKSDYDHDMALLHLETEIPAQFKPVPLLSSEQMQSILEKQSYQVLLVGYGLVSEYPSMRESAVLRETSVPARFEGLHLITDQTGGSGGCNGDSGGPAYLELDQTLYLAGVTHGPTNEVNDCKHEGVWGNPNFEKEFLNESAEKLGSLARF